jgi:membrane protease YdiL (CAAX protease family)
LIDNFGRNSHVADRSYGRRTRDCATLKAAVEPSAEPSVTSFEGERLVERPAPTLPERLVALLEVVICSDFPTQIALGATFAAFGLIPLDASMTQIHYVALLLITDTVLLIGLVLLFLKAHGERPSEVLFGGRPWGREALFALPLTIGALVLAAAALRGLQSVAPWLHNVERNPLEELLRTPADAAIFAVVVVIAGGIREEVQRAFILRRFERWLGGATVGVVVASAAFGAGHALQGADAMVATALLGAFWGVVYLRRRSIVAPIISHAAFDLLQVGLLFVVGR